MYINIKFITMWSVFNSCLQNIRQCFMWLIYIGSPMIWGWIQFLSNELCVFYSGALVKGQKTLNELDKNHIQPLTMEDSFYHMSLHLFSLYNTFQ